MYHGSNTEIKEITDQGIFGGIFAANSPDAAKSHGSNVYEIVSLRHLEDYELNYEIEGAWELALEITNGDEAWAEAIMDKECPNPEGVELDFEDSWEPQRLRGVLAKKLGYTSIEMVDEHGTTRLCLPGCELRKIND